MFKVLKKTGNKYVGCVYGLSLEEANMMVGLLSKKFPDRTYAVSLSAH